MMRKTSIIIILVTLLLSASAQDTILKYPYLYYYDMPQTGVYHDDSVYCNVKLYYTIDGGLGSVSLVLDSMSCVYVYKEIATHFYSSDTLRIVGVAYSANSPASYEVVDSHYLNGYRNVVILYDDQMEKIDSTISCFKYSMDQIVDSLDSNYMWLTIPGYTIPLPTYAYHDSVLLNLTFFDREEPIDIVGDFYLGMYLKGINWNEGYHSIWNFKQTVIYEQHNPPFAFPDRKWRYTCDDEMKDGVRVWVDYYAPHIIPLIFPIIDLPCSEVEGLHIVDSIYAESGMRCIDVDWDSLPQHRQWVVSLEQEGFGTLRTDTVGWSHWSICGLEPDGVYSVGVQAICRSPYPSQSGGIEAPVLAVQAPSAVARGLVATVSPNPAATRTTVTLSEAAPIGTTLTLTASSGQVLMERAVEGGTTSIDLDLTAVPAGVYHLSLGTASTTSSSCLVVVH